MRPFVMRLVLGPLATNCYLLACPKTKECAVIDPADEPDGIVLQAGRAGLSVKLILLTHGHPDHVAGAPKLRELTNAPILLHPADWPLVEQALPQPPELEALAEPFRPDGEIEDGQEIPLGRLKIKALHTPGHTEGSICFLAGDLLFSGDLLFAGSVGRTDLPGGSWEALLNSLRSKIAPLPGDTLVLPGHGPETTVEAERGGNPFFAQALERGD